MKIEHQRFDVHGTTGPRIRAPSSTFSCFMGGKRLGVDVKRADAPTLTASMRIVAADLRLDRLVVLYPGSRRYPLADGIDVMPLADLAAGGAAVLGLRSPIRRHA